MSGRASRAVVWLCMIIAAAMFAACGSGPSSAWADAGSPARGGEWFVQTGCTACHSVSVYGLWNPAVSAPDLSLAVEDVPKRFGRSLEDFLHSPTGTMAMVLSSRIQLDAGQREIAIAQLRAAFALHQQLSERNRPVPSH